MNDKLLSFADHLKILRRLVLIYCLAVIGLIFPAWHFYTRLGSWILDLLGENTYLLQVSDAFMIRLKISITMAFICSIPLLLVLLLWFVFPALTVKQRCWMVFLAFCALFLSLLAAVYSIQIIFPSVLVFLNQIEYQPPSVAKLFTLNGYFSFFFGFIGGFAIAFEMPLLILFLVKIGFVKTDFLVKQLRFVVIGIFVVSAILTPPDIFSQLALALPLIILYILTLPFAWLLQRK